MNSRQLLEWLVETKGIGQSGVERETKVSQATISRFTSGKTKALLPKNAAALARFFNIPAIALLDDEEAAIYAKRHNLRPSTELVVAEASREYGGRSGWPFSADLWHQVSQLDPAQLAKLESLIRVHLDMPAAAPSQRVANG